MPDRLWTQDIEPRLSACIPPTGVIRDYLQWAHKVTHAPPHFHLGAILPCVAYEACRRGFAWSATAGRRNKMHLWTALVGGSSIGKSTVVEGAQDFARSVYDEFLGHGRYKDPWVQADGSPAGLRQTLIETCYDVDVEQTLAILWHDEVARILRWEDGATAFCKFYDGRDYSFHLRHLQKEKQSGTLKSPTLCAVFGGTPSSIERLTNAEHIEGGLFPRILWFRGSVPAERRMLVRQEFPKERAQLVTRWFEWMKALNGISLLLETKDIEISPEALRVVRDELFGKHKKMFALEDRLEGARHRMLSNHVYTVAATYAFSQARLIVSADDMERATRLMLWCMEAVERVTDTLAVTDNVRLRARMMEIIRDGRQEGATYREIYQRTSSAVRDTQAFETCLDLLERAGEIVKFRFPAGGGGGRPRLAYIAREFTTLGDSDSDGAPEPDTRPKL